MAEEQKMEKQPSQTMVYVSNLPFSATDETLKGLFEGFEVKTAYIATRRNGRSKGFGFVNLAKPEDQKKAIEKVDGSELEGRQLTAKVAYNDPRRNELGQLKEEFKKQLENPEPSKTAVYISNLPFSLDNEGLKGIFSEFQVKSATVATRMNGRSMGFGFVEFESVEEQQKALEYDKKEVDTRQISVSVAKNYLGPNRPKRRRKKRGPRQRFRGNSRNNSRRPSSRGPNSRRPNSRKPRAASNKPAFERNPETTLYVANLPFDLDSNDLTEIFAEFNVKEATIATYRSGKSRGFGFVEFNNNKDQQEALEALDQSEVNNRVITVKVARAPRQRRAPRVKRTREPSDTLVYVSNLPFSLTEETFADLFKAYSVNKSYIATRRNGKSKGFGFVDLASNEEQKKVLEELTELECEGRKLTLQVANKVEPKPEPEPKPEQTKEEEKPETNQN